MERRKAWWHLLALAAVILVGFGLRAHGLGRHYFWYDEALILDPAALAQPGPSYATQIWRETTYNPGWPLVVWGFLRAFGNNLTIARVPSCLAGALAIAAAYGAARALRLDRATGLLAALFTALSWSQVEYSQQVLPYAAAPVLTSVCVIFLARIDRTRPDRSLRKAVGPHLALAATCALSVAIHNSFLLMLPVIGLFLVLSWAWPAEEKGSNPNPNPRRARRFRTRRAALGVATLLLILLPAVYFYLPKRGDGFRDYLSVFYLATFRGSASPTYLGQLDAWYQARMGSAAALDVPYFVATRTLDWLVANLNPRFPVEMGFPWFACAGPSLALCVWGAVALGRGRRGRLPALLAASAAAGLGGAVVLSLLKMYPYGGVRQMLPLAPFALLATAVGARCLIARVPVVALGLTAALAVAALHSAPDYYRITRTILDKHGYEKVLRETHVRTVVTGDTMWTANVLKYLGRSCPGVLVYEPTGPEFRALPRSRQPFLLVALGRPPLAWDVGRNGWVADPSFHPPGFDVDDYLVGVHLQCLGADTVQKPMVFILWPKPEVARAGAAATAVQ